MLEKKSLGKVDLGVIFELVFESVMQVGEIYKGGSIKQNLVVRRRLSFGLDPHAGNRIGSGTNGKASNKKEKQNNRI